MIKELLFHMCPSDSTLIMHKNTQEKALLKKDRNTRINECFLLYNMRRRLFLIFMNILEKCLRLWFLCLCGRPVRALSSVNTFRFPRY